VPKVLPHDPTERLEFIGTSLWGRFYRRKLARACGVSANLVHLWPPKAEWLLNQHLLAAINAEQVAAQRRTTLLADMRADLLNRPHRSPR
jgi:hypothetical protein